MRLSSRLAMTAGAVGVGAVAVLSGSLGASPADEPSHDREGPGLVEMHGRMAEGHRDMAGMHDEMMGRDPEMARMHEQMIRDNPGMAEMHEQMMGR